MKMFSSDRNKKIIYLLRQSNQDFKFEQSQGKIRLLENLNQAPTYILDHNFNNSHVFRYSVIAVSLLVVISGSTMAYAATWSRPGDALFPVSKLSQSVILNLPLSAETKANFQARIVSNRLTDLTAIQTEDENMVNEPQVQTRALETVQESDDSINAAIQAVSAKKESFTASGNVRAAAQMDETLNTLQNLAQQHEQKIQILESQTTNTQFKTSLETHLNHIHSARNKALQELGQDENSDN